MSVDLSFITTPAPGLKGSAASVIAGAPAGHMRVTGLSAMTPLVVGQRLFLQDSVNPGNDGLFLISAFISATTVDVVNASAVVPDAGPLVWVQVNGQNNNWTIQPSGDDAKDSPDIQVALTCAPLMTRALGLPAIITLGPGTFYIRTELESADFRGFIQPVSTSVTLIAGTVAGGPMDFLTEAKARVFAAHGFPNLIRFYGELGGIGTSVSIKDINFATNPSTNDSVGVLSWAVNDDTANGPAPWDNFACLSFIRVSGINGQYKTGLNIAITAHDGANKQTITSFSPLFDPTDVGKTLTNWDSPDVANNGQFLVTDYVSPTQIKILNAAGVVNAFPNNRWSILNPQIVAQRADLEVDNCTFTGHYGDNVPLYGNPISNVNVGIIVADVAGHDVYEGTATPPFTLNSPTAPFLFPNTNWEFRAYKRVGPDRYFWFVDAHLPINARVNITNSSFEQIGAAVVAQNIMGSTQNYPWIEMPAGAVDPVLNVDGCVMTDCGLSSVGGATAIIVLLAQGGQTHCDNNEIVFSNGGQFDTAVADSLRGAFLGSCSTTEWLPDPTQLTLWGDNGEFRSIPNTWGVNRPANTIIATFNDFDMGPATLPGQQPAFAALSVNDRATAVNDPIGVTSQSVIAHNILKGNARVICGLHGQYEYQVHDNQIAGIQAEPQLWIFVCASIIMTNNKFLLRSDPQVQLDADTRNSRVVDTLGNLPLVADLGKANSQIGCQTSTNPAGAIPDPWG